MRLMRNGALSLTLFLAAAAVAAAAAPNFGAAIYADGEAYGTKGTTDLPPPNGHNMQSFDKLLKVVNSNNPGMQLPVAEAAPGNRNYNGGRWATYVVTWTQEGFDAHGVVPILKSYADIMYHKRLGHLTVAPGDIGGPQAFFQCPLLPFK